MELHVTDCRRGGLSWILILTVLILAAPHSTVWAGTAPPQSAPIRILVLKTEAEARAAVADLADGIPFEQLVRQLSIGPERERGGYLGRVSLAGLSAAARAALAKTPPGRVSPIFPAENGFALVQVLTNQQAQELEERSRREPEAQELLARDGTRPGRRPGGGRSPPETGHGVESGTGGRALQPRHRVSKAAKTG